MFCKKPLPWVQYTSGISVECILQLTYVYLHSSIIIPNCSEMSVWDGVVVNPLERAYEKPADMTGEEDMEAEEGDMEAE